MKLKMMNFVSQLLIGRDDTQADSVVEFVCEVGIADKRAMWPYCGHPIPTP